MQALPTFHATLCALLTADPHIQEFSCRKRQLNETPRIVTDTLAHLAVTIVNILKLTGQVVTSCQSMPTAVHNSQNNYNAMHSQALSSHFVGDRLGLSFQQSET